MLHRIDEFDSIPESCRGGVVSIGNFDGVHRGHVALADCMAQISAAAQVPAVAFTFDPHPAQLLRPEHSPVPLTWTERKSQLLHEHAVTEVLVIRTSRELLQLTPDEFFERVIRRGLAARALVEGPNFAFGRNRAGSIATLRRLCDQTQVQLEVVDPLVSDGQVVSSSRVRSGLASGDVEMARRLLGRPHRVRGRVGSGAGRGADLGFPTANLQECETFVPAPGVYAARAHVQDDSWPAAVHVGPNATFNETATSVEAHLIGYQGNLRALTIDIDFLARIRDTVKFANPRELADQIRQDVQRTIEVAQQD